MTTWQTYLITGKKLQKVVEEELSLLMAWNRKWRALRKKYGFKSEWENQFGNRRTVQAVDFKDAPAPDSRLWAKTDHSQTSYWPKANTTEGRAIKAEFEAIKTFNESLVEDAVGFKWISVGKNLFPFNFFHYPKQGVSGFKVPVIPDELSREDKAKAYKPVAGVKLISHTTLLKKIHGKNWEKHLDVR